MCADKASILSHLAWSSKMWSCWSGPGRIGLRLCMLIENSQKVNEQKVSLALVIWVTFPHFSPLLSSLANKRRKEQKSDRLLWKASHCWPRKKKKSTSKEERAGQEERQAACNLQAESMGFELFFMPFSLFFIKHPDGMCSLSEQY